MASSTLAPPPPTSAFVVTKHSWKGKYRRVLSLSNEFISTLNPSTMEATNSWKLSDIVSAQPLNAPGSSANSELANGTGSSGPSATHEFQLTYKKGKKNDNMRFSSEWRSTILTEVWAQLQKHTNNDSPDAIQATKTWFAYKYHWSEQRQSLALRIGTHAVEQLDASSKRVLAAYNFKDIRSVYEVSNYPGGFCLEVGSSGRLHLFAAEAKAEILQKLLHNSTQFIGVSIEKPKPMTFEKFVDFKFGKYSSDIHITSLSEFTVYKQSERRLTSNNQPEQVRRTLCLTESCLIERDPATYSIVSLQPLTTISALIRHPTQSQLLTIQYNSGRLRSYASTDRDSLIASFLDGVRGAGNRDVHVRACSGPLERGKRLGPLHLALEEEVESMHLKYLVTPPQGWSFFEAVSRFNANVPYSGLIHSVTAEHLFAENKEKLIHNAMLSLIDKFDTIDPSNIEATEQQFHALRRLVASKAGFAGFTVIPLFREKVGKAVAKALRFNHDGISHAAIDMLCALMEPMHEDYDLKQEQLNKSSLLSSEKFLDGLLDMWSGHVNRGTGALVVAAMLDLLTFALCAPYSETTEGKQFDILLEKVANHGRTLYRLFQQPSHTIVKGAGLLMKAIIEEATPETAKKMQQLAMAEGALPIHLLKALYTKSSDNRLLMHAQLSKHLVGLWTTNCKESDQLLERIFPAGLLRYLNLDDKTPTSETDRLHVRDNLQMALTDAGKNKGHALLRAAHKGLQDAKHTSKKVAEVVSEKSQQALEKTAVYTDEARKVAEKHLDLALQHWRTKMGDEWRKALLERHKDEGGAAPSHSGSGKGDKNTERPIVLRMRRQNLKSSLNWPLFYYQFGQDHSKPDLIWNFKTRQELKDGLETEIQAFLQDRELLGGSLISWNHTEFSVTYNSLADEIKIGDYFLRILLGDGKGEMESNEESPINKSGEFFNDLYHRFLLTPKTEMKCLCLQAMTIVYGKHHEEIGCFHDTKYIVAMLDRTVDRIERDRLLLFLEKLILHKDNVPSIIQSNGIRILLELLPLAHLHTSRAVINNQSTAIEANPDTTKDCQEKEWYYGNADKERNGPISFHEMKDLFEKKDIGPRTKVWAQGLEGWRLLQQVAQLKWTLMAKSTAVMNESELASRILGVLITLCKYYPSIDEDGAIIRPLPKVKAALSEPSSLPHVVQLLLTFDPTLVEKVSVLLSLVLEENPRLPTLYLSGCFFFILMYTGSNLLDIGRFLGSTHCKQAFRSEEKDKSELIDRSVLAQMLPEAMVAYLENHGAEKFAQIFLGEYDTPEAIWNNEMRQFMIQKIAYHLADFTPRLKSNIKALYQYCPIPLVSYPALEEELFCDIYYLRNLCDLPKFPDWPVLSPLKLLKEVLLAWKVEVEKKPSSMTTADALAILGLKMLPNTSEPPDESRIRKAYFKMAQQYHPDKNPKGREMFEKVNNAYEFLCSKASKVGNAPNADNLVLILRTQSILFRRFNDELHPYKYAGYPMLIKTIANETNDEKLFHKSAPLLAAASECAYFTVKCSALNAEELRRENGLEVLYAAFERCISVLSASSKIEDVGAQVCKHMANFYAVASQFEQCRVKMIEITGLCKNVCRIFYYRHLTPLCMDAAVCTSSLAIDGILQMQLLQAGVLWHLLTFLFEYDYTLEEGGVETEGMAGAVGGEGSKSKQAVQNSLAELAIYACARLAGVLEDPKISTPKNPVIEDCLKAMLMPYIVGKMKKNDAKEILKLLNSNTKNPYIVWDNGTRAELAEFLETERTSIVRRGTCDPAFGAEFKYSAHKDELVVGNIFVRIYNEQPDFQLEEPKRFAVDLLEFLNGQAQYLYSLMSMTAAAGKGAGSNQTRSSERTDPSSPSPADRLRLSEMALEALANVMKNNKGVDIQCIGHFKLIFFLLRLESCPRIQEMSLQVLNNVTGSAECVNDIAANNVLVNLFQPLYSSLIQPSVVSGVGAHDYQPTLCLSILHSLMGDTRLVKECINFNGIICLLFIFCCEKDEDVRKSAAEVLCKMTADKLMGPKVRIAVSRFLPEIFLDAMKNSSETTLRMYENSHENPELIWNETSRDNLSKHLQLLAKQHSEHLKQSPETPWRSPQDEAASSGILSNGSSSSNHSSANLQNELVISGIYIRLFIANPGWLLRKPREFLIDLIENILQLMSSNENNNEKLESLTTALVKLLEAQPPLAEIVPATGYISRILSSLSTAGSAMLKPCVLILHQLSRSTVCGEAIAKCEAVAPLKRAMALRRDLLYSISETLHSLFERHHDNLVKQALECDLLNEFLSILDSPLQEVESPSGCKALIVKAVKAMQCSLLYGEQISAILKDSQVWQQYAQQKHDLFLTDRTNLGGLTYNTGVAGYLTTTQKAAPSLPPPNMDGASSTSGMHNDLLL